MSPAQFVRTEMTFVVRSDRRRSLVVAFAVLWLVLPLDAAPWNRCVGVRDPTTDSTYAPCVYGTSAGAASLALNATVAPGEIEEPDDEDDFDEAEDTGPASSSEERGWKEISRRSTEGFRYLDPVTHAQDGIASIALLASESRTDRIRIFGVGPNLPVPTPRGGPRLRSGREAGEG
jgi:hypothetical protein